jgi:hypothetical protein
MRSRYLEVSVYVALRRGQEMCDLARSRRRRGSMAHRSESSAVSTRMAATMKVIVVRLTDLGVSEEKLWREFRSSYPMGAHPYFSVT